MALLNCPECGGKVSSTAKTCPHCGYEMSPKEESGLSGFSSFDDSLETSGVSINNQGRASANPPKRRRNSNEVSTSSADVPTDGLDVVVHRNHKVPYTFSVVYMAVGALLAVACLPLFMLTGKHYWITLVIIVVLALAIMMLIMGAMVKGRMKKNNLLAKEVVYCDRKTKTFYVVDIKGKQIGLNESEIKSKVAIVKGVGEYVGVIYNKKVQLGWTIKEDMDAIKNYLDRGFEEKQEEPEEGKDEDESKPHFIFDD